jgi:hypothetical protein
MSRLRVLKGIATQITEKIHPHALPDMEDQLRPNQKACQ